MAEPDDDIAEWATGTNWANGPLTGTVTKVTPTAGQIADGFVGGQSFKSQQANYVVNNHGEYLTHMRDDYNGLFGDASDGDDDISGNTTLAREMFYGTVRVETGGQIITDGYRIYARVLIIEAGGRVQNDGDDGGPAVDGGPVGPAGGGGGASTGTLGEGGGGRIGVNNGNGLPANGVADSIGGAGGAGGDAGVGTGGAGGAATAPAAADGGFRSASTPLGVIAGRSGTNVVLTLLRGGGGGGSAASNGGSSYSGGGGGGGGIVAIYAHTILIDPDAVPAISADGGDAGVSAPGSADSGGSGGGGGGGVLIVFRRLLVGVSLDTATPTEPEDLAAAGVFVQALGGAGAPAVGGLGDPGVDGSDGTVLWFRV